MPLTPSELRDRRDRARHDRRRRRRVAIGALAGLAALIVLVVVAVGSSGSSGSSGSTTTGAAAPATATTTTARHHRLTVHHHAHAAPPNEQALELAAIAKARAANGYLVRGTPRHKDVALTFDDGPGPTTPKILSWLKAHDVPATFFLIGANARAEPKLVKEEVAAGDVVGDHTESHARLGGLSTSIQHGEIADGAQAINAITGQRVRLFRPPYGSFDDTTRQLLADAGLLMVLWTVDTKDYSMPGVDRIVFVALSGARAGTVILFHDGGGDRTQTLQALPRIVHRLRLEGYHLVTVPQLLVADPVDPHQPAPHSLAGG